MGINIPEAELHDLVLRRECIPGVDRLQTAYTRYYKRGEAQAQHFWQAPLSRKNYEHHARVEQQHFLPSDHLLFTDLSPESVSMKIVQAPAEFALPVKQDRRLSPSFKVKVEVKYRSQVSIPLTLKAFIVTQHDKDNILSWHPDDMTDQDKKKITELKGTTSITHYFEASSAGGSKRAPHAAAASHVMDMAQSGMPSKSVSPAMLLQIWNSERSIQPDQWQQPGSLPIKPIDLGLGSNPGMAGLPDMANLPGTSHGVMDAGVSRALQGGGGRDLLSQGLGQGLLGTRSGNAGEGGGGGDLYGLLGLDNWHTSQLQQQHIQAHMLQELQQIQQQQQQQHQLQQLQQQLQHMLNPRPQQQQQQQQQQEQKQQGQAGQHAAQQQPSGELATVDHEFEFSNLEFVRPTRMNKVYMVFACTLMDMDLIYSVYNVPTVGICRAEQREKACQKLGMCLPAGLMMADGPMHVKHESELGKKREAKESEESLQRENTRTSEALQKRVVPSQPSDAMESELTVDRRSIDDDALAIPYSRAALKCWILEQYESTGLTRKLSELDIKALLSQAGFPTDASATVKLSQGQWEEFMLQFKGVLQLLQQIANVWNLQEPCIISGFDMDRMGTIQALGNEPAGTFICRFSMSQPGCLVLTCKTIPGHACSDKDNLLHAIIKIDDLYERRVDTWIRDFAGASHVLDVYRQKRVDKRKVFASNYTNLRGLDLDAHPADPV